MKAKWPREAPMFEHAVYGLAVGVDPLGKCFHSTFINILLCEQGNRLYSAWATCLKPLTPAAREMLAVAYGSTR